MVAETRTLEELRLATGKAEVSFEGATYVEVAFDKRTATENNCDYLRFYAEAGASDTCLPDTDEKYD